MHPGQSGEIALMAEPVWQFRLSVGNEPLFSVPVRTQGCQTFPNAHPWASHPIALGGCRGGRTVRPDRVEGVSSWEALRHGMSGARIARVYPIDIRR